MANIYLHLIEWRQKRTPIKVDCQWGCGSGTKRLAEALYKMGVLEPQFPERKITNAKHRCCE